MYLVLLLGILYLYGLFDGGFGLLLLLDDDFLGVDDFSEGLSFPIKFFLPDLEQVKPLHDGLHAGFSAGLEVTDDFLSSAYSVSEHLTLLADPFGILNEIAHSLVKFLLDLCCSYFAPLADPYVIVPASEGVSNRLLLTVASDEGVLVLLN